MEIYCKIFNNFKIYYDDFLEHTSRFISKWFAVIFLVGNVHRETMSQAKTD